MRTLAILQSLAWMLALTVAACTPSPTTEGSSSTAPAGPSSATPEGVVARYGAPDVVTSSEYENPRPPIVTKFLTYTHEHVRFVFVANVPMGTPPPYSEWKLIFLQDPRDKSAITADQTKQRLSSRAR
jgi:hypothetical protein